MSKLYELTGNYLRLQDMAAEGILDEATFRDTLASIEGDISDKADGYGKLIRNLEADTAALDAEIKRLKARKASMDKTKANLRDWFCHCMEAMQKEQIKTSLFTWSRKLGKKSVVIEDEQKFAEWAQHNNADSLLRYSTPEPNKEAILEAFEGGKALPFVSVDQKPTVTLR